MKLYAEINNRTVEIEIGSRRGKLAAVVDGVAIDAEFSRPEPGVYLLKYDGRVYEAFVGRAGQVSIEGRNFEIAITDPKKLRTSAGGADLSQGMAEIRAAMPGKVVRLIATPGAQVAKGDGILVVEAMKMQNELKAPKAGLVREVKVAEGDTVGAGEVLATIE